MSEVSSSGLIGGVEDRIVTERLGIIEDAFDNWTKLRDIEIILDLAEEYDDREIQPWQFGMLNTALSFTYNAVYCSLQELRAERLYDRFDQCMEMLQLDYTYKKDKVIIKE